MKTRGTIGFFAVCALALAMIAPAARADEQNQASQLTFNQAVRIPNGVVLQPGTYWFRVSEDPADRNLVRVTDANGALITTLLTASADRPAITDHTMLKLAEAGPNQPYTLVKWFYPGRTIGHEFLYSPRTESQISEEKQITVMATQAPNGTQVVDASY